MEDLAYILSLTSVLVEVFGLYGLNKIKVKKPIGLKESNPWGVSDSIDDRIKEFNKEVRKVVNQIQEDQNRQAWWFGWLLVGVLLQLVSVSIFLMAHLKEGGI